MQCDPSSTLAPSQLLRRRMESARFSFVRQDCMNRCGSTGRDQPEFQTIHSKKKPRITLVRMRGYACSLHRYAKRRARESNPQLLAQRLISNQLPNHSVTLRSVCYSLSEPLSRQYRCRQVSLQLNARYRVLHIGHSVAGRKKQGATAS